MTSWNDRILAALQTMAAGQTPGTGWNERVAQSLELVAAAMKDGIQVPPVLNITWTGNLQPILSIEASNDTVVIPWGGQAGIPASIMTFPGPGMCAFSYQGEWLTDKLTGIAVDARWFFGPSGMLLTAASLASCDLSKLEAAITTANGSALNITCSGGVLGTLKLDKLKYVHSGGSGALTIAGGTFDTLDLPALTHLINDSGTGCINVGTCPNLATVNMPNIIEMAGAGGPFNAVIFSSGNGNIANVYLGTIGITKIARGGVTFNGQKLTQASVDRILNLLASLDGTNGTTLYSAGTNTVDLSGGTNAAPSFTGQQVNVTGAADGGGGKTIFTTADIVAAGGAAWAVGDCITIPSTSAIVPTGYKGTYQVVAGTNDATHCTVTKAYTTNVTTPGACKRGAVGDGYRSYQLLASRSNTVTIN